MTFTIPMFWMGVIATLGVELAALIVAAVFKNNQRKRVERRPFLNIRK